MVFNQSECVQSAFYITIWFKLLSDTFLVAHRGSTVFDKYFNNFSAFDAPTKRSQHFNSIKGNIAGSNILHAARVLSSVATAL